MKTTFAKGEINEWKVTSGAQRSALSFLWRRECILYHSVNIDRSGVRKVCKVIRVFYTF